MNIYLDIDGVLLANETSASEGTDEFLQTVLKKYPDSTFWLTTHNWQGENRAKDVLSPHLEPETVALIDNIKPSEWGELKTDAIDFSQEFLWFDDDLWPDELAVLEENNATHRFVMIDLNKNPLQIKQLVAFINAL